MLYPHTDTQLFQFCQFVVDTLPKYMIFDFFRPRIAPFVSSPLVQMGVHTFLDVGGVRPDKENRNMFHMHGFHILSHSLQHLSQHKQKATIHGLYFAW